MPDCCITFAGAMVFLVLAAVRAGQSETVPTESFGDISVRINIIYPTTGRMQFSFTRRSRSAGGCPISTRFFDLIRVSGNCRRDSSHTQDNVPAHRALRERARCRLLSVVREQFLQNIHNLILPIFAFSQLVYHQK